LSATKSGLRGRETFQRLTARYPGTCPACQCRIRPGQTVVRVPAIPEWLHDGDCVDVAESLIRAKAWKRCGSFTKRGHPCRNWITTASATACHLHA